MDDDFFSAVVAFLVGVVIALTIAVPITEAITSANWRDSAVARGYAEYVIDGSRTKWQWKELSK